MSIVPAEATADPLLGATLAERYRVVRRIGKGGMGVVYEAVHLALGKRVAIKLLLDKYADDHDAVERFHREALTATQIGDAHIIDVLDIGTASDGRSFVVLELLAGHDLGKVLAASGPMPAARAVHIISQVLRGLGAAHAKGIVHRDMKPDNVFVVPDPETPDFVKILDFGISKVMAAQDARVRLTATGTIVGTPVYMAPEQAMGVDVDHRADLYSVGVMLYELLAGRPPFVADSYLALVTQHLQAVPPDLAALRPDLPRRLVNAIHRALSKEPDQRFHSADDFIRALPSRAPLRDVEALGATHGSAPVAYTPDGRAVAPVMGASTARSLSPPGRARRRWIAGGALGAAAIGAAIAAAFGGGSGAATTRAGARLAIETSPAGVRVFVDDEHVGAAPIVLTDLAPGKHRVRLELDGYVSLSTVKELAADENASITVPMQPDPGPSAAAPPPSPSPPPPPSPSRPDVTTDHPRADRPRADRPRTDRPRADRPRADRPGRPSRSNPPTSPPDPAPKTSPPPKTDPPKDPGRQKPNPYGD